MYVLSKYLAFVRNGSWFFGLQGNFAVVLTKDVDAVSSTISIGEFYLFAGVLNCPRSRLLEIEYLKDLFSTYMAV